MQYAKENGAQIFNAIHSSMRQWGSSLKHNGMSFFAASIPNNTLFYHGTHRVDPVEGMEWLAFEIEHAEMFAESRGSGGKRPGGGPPGGGPGSGPGGKRSEGRPSNGPPKEQYGHHSESKTGDRPDNKEQVDGGYLRIYRTKKPLKLLYLDGMAAGKTDMGTLDTQDRLLVNTTWTPHGPGGMGERDRALKLCDLVAEYAVDGILRMEAGFEIILCNFSTGVELVSAYKRPKAGTKESEDGMRHLEYVRGIGTRYQGITAGRVAVDYSSMVSAFFHPLNLTNPDSTRQELPRLPLPIDDKIGLARLKSDVLDIFKEEESPHSSIDWQGVVDMIVTRYSDRLQFIMSSTSTQDELLSEIGFLLTLFIEYADASPSLSAATEKCANHYLLPVLPETKSDHLIHAAIYKVTNKICKTLFSARALLLTEEKGAMDEVKIQVKALTEDLNWSTWTTCEKCGYDEVCFIAIWPWGAAEDHFKPSCLKNKDLAGRSGYWGGRM